MRQVFRFMNAERWKKIDELFGAVLEVSETEREKFLAENCNGDDDLINEVLSLLKTAPRIGNFLETSAMRVAANKLSEENATVPNSSFQGKTIGKYKIEKPIGAGGMGEVYLAWDDKLRRKVALKILPAEYTASDERVKRFELEAKAISILNHPNIVTIFDVGTASAEGINYIATEFVEGRTLRELVGKNPKIREILSVTIQVCEALATAHSAGIVHRDIKPENIIVRPDGYVKVLDFGLAKLNRSEPHRFGDFAKTAEGVVIGTPAYMSPAQIGDDTVDHRTDLWSLGVVLYELLTGTNPFKKENRRETLQAILATDPPPPSSANPDIPAELGRILLKALDKDTDLSYQSATDLRADLRRVKRELDSPTSSTFASNNATESTAQRKYLIFAAALLFLPLLGFAIWYFASHSEAPAVNIATEWENAQNLQLTASPWVEGYPSISPDGKDIVFASEIEGDGNIYRQRIGGKTQTNLTPNSKQRDTMPAFSPNGKFIAFRSEREPSGIYVMEETGENVRRVSDLGYHPSWSPDSKRIVVSDRFSGLHTAHIGPNSSLWIINAENGEKQKLQTNGDAIMPSWSPNGQRIAFWFVTGGNSGEIATIPAEGGEPVVIASDAAADWNPVWSPDGKYLYFASNRNGNMNFWRVPLDETSGQQTGSPEPVSTPSKYCRHIAFSRDGKLLAYVRYESKSNLQSIAFDPKTLKTQGEVAWITRGNNEISNPQLSPDGERFLVRNPGNTEEDIAVFDKDGGNWRSLTDDRFRERSPRWSPDGKQVAFQSDRSGKFQIWTINADGSNLRQITFTEKSGATSAVFSPDGKRMAFTETDGDIRKLMILDLTKSWAEQPPSPLPPFPGSILSFSARDWSKDGKKLLVNYFEPGGDEGGIAVFDLETAKYERITEIGGTPFWLNDNRNFIFTRDNIIFLGDATTRSLTEIYKPSAYELQHANISPDNRMIFFRYLQVDADVWLLDVSPER